MRLPRLSEPASPCDTCLIHQAKTHNIGVNRMLDKYVTVAATRYVEKPGVASADEFYLRCVFR